MCIEPPTQLNEMGKMRCSGPSEEACEEEGEGSWMNSPTCETSNESALTNGHRQVCVSATELAEIF